MALCKGLLRNKIFTYYLAKVVFIYLALSVYVFFLLKTIDHILSRLVIGYQTTESYLLSSVIFFIAALFFFYFAIKYNWTRLFHYLSIAIAVYFPLVALSSIIKIYDGLTDTAYQLYIENICFEETAFGLCGEALAHMVLSMSIRALPVVLSVPFLYWASLKYLKISNPREQVDV